MTNKELKEKIVYLEAELAEVKKMAVAMEKKADGGLFKPEDGQKYWSIMHGGCVAAVRWHDHEFTHDRYAIGNCFPTQQEAEDAVRALKLIQKARESQDGFVPDWEDFEQNKHIVYYNRGVLCVRMYSHLNIAPIFGYWEDKSVCEQFIDENREEVLWFFMEYRR